MCSPQPPLCFRFWVGTQRDQGLLEAVQPTAGQSRLFLQDRELEKVGTDTGDAAA